MKRISYYLLISALFSLTFAQAPTGSKSLLNTQTARTFEPGRFEVRTDMNFFTKLAEFVGNQTLKPANFKAANYWLVNSSLALTFGVVDHFDITVIPGLYQDTHTPNEYNLPDDIRVFAKVGSFDFADRSMYAGFTVGTRFPLGEDHNYPFTYYASGAVEYGVSGILSYYADPYIPDRSLSAHLTLGWWNYNEAGNEVYKDKFATVNSNALNYAVGIVYPTDMFDFQLEIFGLSYLTQPDEFVYAREDWTYITPSIKYKPFSWFNFNLGVDIRVSSDVDESAGINKYENVGLPNYTAWKAHLGFELTLLPLTDAVGNSPAAVQQKQFNKRVEFFQEIIEEREKSENIKEELDKLQEEREAAEQELEELKQILEDEGGDL